MHFHARRCPGKKNRTVLFDHASGSTRHQFNPSWCVAGPMHKTHVRAAASQDERTPCARRSSADNNNLCFFKVFFMNTHSILDLEEYILCGMSGSKNLPAREDLKCKVWAPLRRFAHVAAAADINCAISYQQVGRMDETNSKFYVTKPVLR